MSKANENLSQQRVQAAVNHLISLTGTMASSEKIAVCILITQCLLKRVDESLDLVSVALTFGATPAFTEKIPDIQQLLTSLPTESLSEISISILKEHSGGAPKASPLTTETDVKTSKTTDSTRSQFSYLPEFQDFVPEDVEDVNKATTQSDRKILAELSPLLELLTWQERATLGQTAYWFISISSQYSLLKLVPVRGDGSAAYSKELQRAMQLVETLSTQALAALVMKILKEDTSPEKLTEVAIDSLDNLLKDIETE